MLAAKAIIAKMENCILDSGERVTLLAWKHFLIRQLVGNVRASFRRCWDYIPGRGGIYILTK
jgi:hypothetical protein